MAVTEAQRHRLYESLRSSLGDRDADTFMNLMPPATWTEFAMKSDIADLRADIKTDIAELRAENADRHGQLLRTFGTWLFVSQAGVIAAVTLVIAAVTLVIAAVTLVVALLN